MIWLWQATHGSIFGQEAVLQVNHRLADLLVFGEHVVVVQHHAKVLFQWERTCELKHPVEKESRKGFSALVQALGAFQWPLTRLCDHINDRNCDHILNACRSDWNADTIFVVFKAKIMS